MNYVQQFGVMQSVVVLKKHAAKLAFFLNGWCLPSWVCLPVLACKDLLGNSTVLAVFLMIHRLLCFALAIFSSTRFDHGFVLRKKRGYKQSKAKKFIGPTTANLLMNKLIKTVSQQIPPPLKVWLILCGDESTWGKNKNQQQEVIRQELATKEEELQELIQVSNPGHAELFKKIELWHYPPYQLSSKF